MLLGLLWLVLTVGSQPYFQTQKGIILEGPLISWAPSLGTVQSPCLSKALGPHPNTFRKLFPAESCFELSIIIFLAIPDPDKYWPRHKNVWIRTQVREFGVAFEQVCVDLISLGLSYFLAWIPLKHKDLWCVGPQSWESKSSKSVSSFRLSLTRYCVAQHWARHGNVRKISLLLLYLGRLDLQVKQRIENRTTNFFFFYKDFTVFHRT